MNGLIGLFVGDVGLDLSMVTHHLPEPDEKVHVEQIVEASGGVAANAAVACRRSGAQARLLARLGDDAAGTRIRHELADAGIDLSIEATDGPSCRSVVIVEPHGEKRLLLAPGDTMYPSWEAVDREPLEGIGWVHTAAYGPAASRLIERCRSHNVPWSLDLEPATLRPDALPLRSLVDGAAAVFLNRRAAILIGDDAPATLMRMGAAQVIETRGASGARLSDASSATEIAASPIDRVVDTTGAGDCLAGWFIGELLAGASPPDALAGAVIAATLSCGALGAQASYPDRSQVSSLRNSMIEPPILRSIVRG